MPTIDHDRGVLVVRVVYDGPAFSGKTTSLRTLASGFGVAMNTPSETNGRTLFFDWVDYVGGLFEGRQIRCQIVSVPGQPELAARRRLLIDSADAVVLVADTRATALDAALDVLCDLLPQCRNKEPPVGVVVQANKRDTPDSLPREEVQALLDAIAPSSLVETVATVGEGVREAFVFAVRLALDRVRWLADRGEIPEGPPLVDTPEDLLAQLRALGDHRLTEPVSALSDAAPPSRSATLVPHALAPTAEDAPPPEDEKVFRPDPMMPGGFIWPPVDGRSLLYEVARVGIVPRRTEDGDWHASEGAWRCHSAASALFDDADGGRRALIEWARLHATNLRKLSSRRALILAPAGSGRFRLWQLVRVEKSCHDRLAGARDAEPERLAGELRDALAHLLRAREVLHTPALRLPCTLATVGGNVSQDPIYVGIAPAEADALGVEEEGDELLERELGPVVRGLAEHRSDFAQVVALMGRNHETEESASTRFVARLGDFIREGR